jgi:hypothetical protein
MKTITIDYNLYLQELRDAKEEGFNIVPKLKPELEKLCGILSNGYASSQELYQCRTKIYDIILQLDKVEKWKS